ncbi:MAG: SCP2 sterol-binding domain-containing protein [Bacteroidota bacterium]
MTIDELTAEVHKSAANMPQLGKSIKLALKEGTIHIDLTGDSPAITNEDKDADCVITTDIDTLVGMRTGSVNPMMAMMGGKIKIKGDMGLAMKLQGLLT